MDADLVFAWAPPQRQGGAVEREAGGTADDVERERIAGIRVDRLEGIDVVDALTGHCHRFGDESRRLVGAHDPQQVALAADALLPVFGGNGHDTQTRSACPGLAAHAP